LLVEFVHGLRQLAIVLLLVHDLGLNQLDFGLPLLADLLLLLLELGQLNLLHVLEFDVHEHVFDFSLELQDLSLVAFFERVDFAVLLFLEVVQLVGLPVEFV